jgi:hypothetical protein
MPWSFINHITEHLERPGLSEQKHPTQWPSEASAFILNEYGESEIIGKCRRANYFRYLMDLWNFQHDEESSELNQQQEIIKQIYKNSKEPDPYLKWIWKQGEIYEQYCVDLAKESGVFIATQVSLYIPKLNVSGKIDLVVIDPETHKYHIVEVKSVYGFNANSVIGTPGERKKGELGKPRESHLMQIGLYQWWYGNVTDNFAEGLLVYGSRDTGRFGEYKVTVERVDDKDWIFYQGNCPNVTDKINSGISIQSICEQYSYIQKCVKEFIVPERDYDLLYSEEKIDLLYQRGLLNKAETERYEKRKLQVESGKDKLNKAIEKGDWQCDLCQYKDICYDSNSKAKVL